MHIPLRLAVLLAVSAALVAACDDSPTEPGDVQLSFETVLNNSYSGITGPELLSIRDAGEWPRTWERLHAGLSPVPPLPAVDFDRRMLLLAALGSRANGCFAVEITDISLKRSGEIEIEVMEDEPGPACGCTQAVTNPVHVVSLERVDAYETFRSRRQQMSC